MASEGSLLVVEGQRRARRARTITLAVVLSSAALIALRSYPRRRISSASLSAEWKRTCWMEYRAKNGNGYKIVVRKIPCPGDAPEEDAPEDETCDDDACLQAKPGWEGNTCQGSASWCEDAEWAPDVQDCCSTTCGTGCWEADPPLVDDPQLPYFEDIEQDPQLPYFEDTY